MVATTAPRIVQPSKGVLRLFDFERETSNVQLSSGSRIVTSPHAPSRKVPRFARLKMRAGLVEHNSTRRLRLIVPLLTKADGSFKPDDAKRRLIVFERLLVCVVRRVVCGDSVNRPVA